MNNDVLHSQPTWLRRRPLQMLLVLALLTLVAASTLGIALMHSQHAHAASVTGLQIYTPAGSNSFGAPNGNCFDIANSQTWTNPGVTVDSPSSNNVMFAFAGTCSGSRSVVSSITFSVPANATMPCYVNLQAKTVSGCNGA